MVTLSSLRRSVEAQQGTDGLDSAAVSAIAGSGVAVYDTLDSLPMTGLTAGAEAFVKGNNRLYVSNGSGWYNITLVNRNPRWDSGGEPLVSYTITDSATPLIITARAVDSDNPDSKLLNQSFASDSAQYIATITSDSSVFTFTPKSADSIGIEVANGNLVDSDTSFTYTFKWSDGISILSKAVSIGYNTGPALSLAWSNNASDPYIAYTSITDATKTSFAFPVTADPGGNWQYSTDASTWNNFSSAATLVGPVTPFIFNGQEWTYYYISGNWTTGNTNYYIRHSSLPFGSTYTGETQAYANNAGNYPE